MPSAGEIKNAARTGREVAKAATDVKQGLSFLKALTNGRDSKISNWTAFFMISVALFIDILQLIVGIFDAGYFSSPIATGLQFLIFTFWFAMHGVSYWGKSKLASKVISIIIENVVGLIPWVNTIFPSAAIMVAAAIAITRMEEAAAKAESGPQENAKNQEGDIKSPKRPGSDVNLKNEKRPARTRPA